VTAWANIHRRGVGRYRQCGGKVRYRTLRQARWSAAERRRISGETTIAPYKCSFGHHWHVGHGEGIGEPRRKRHYWEGR
jgi:hypothetical protein